jgi:uncharacterized membrane protein YoaK (UPF0700 family)
MTISSSLTTISASRRPWVTTATEQQRARNALLVLLTAASGAVDAISFLGLGQVFTAVMTGNMVFLGLAIGRGAFGSAARSAASIPGYALGVALGTRLTARAEPGVWPRVVSRALRIEFAIEVVLLTAWITTGGKPGSGADIGLIVLSAIAMGTQSAAVRILDVPSLSTTYLTGTLTWLVTQAATHPSRLRHCGVQGAALVALVIGAITGAVAMQAFPRFAFAIPAALIGCAALGGPLVAAGPAEVTAES